MHLKFFIMFIKCDGDEGDKLCLKYLCRSGNVSCLCRYCKCPTYKSSRVTQTFPAKTEEEIKGLVDKGLNGTTKYSRDTAKEKLKRMSQQCLPNALHGVRFGLHNFTGVHGACPIDMLHHILLGMFVETKNQFFKQIGPESAAAREINDMAKLFSTFYAHQSDRLMPITRFKNGIQVSKLQAKEHIGVLLIMATILHSQAGRAVLRGAYGGRFREETILDDWAMLVELLLGWERFLMLDVMKKAG